MKPVQLNSPGLNNIHTIVFKLDSKRKCFTPHEFAEGPIYVSKSGLVENDVIDDSDNFINDLRTISRRKTSPDIIGFQCLGAIKIGNQHTLVTAEFDLGENGTITLPTFILKDVELVLAS